MQVQCEFCGVHLQNLQDCAHLYLLAAHLPSKLRICLNHGPKVRKGSLQARHSQLAWMRPKDSWRGFDEMSDGSMMPLYGCCSTALVQFSVSFKDDKSPHCSSLCS